MLFIALAFVLGFAASLLDVKAYNTGLALGNVVDGLERMAEGQNVPDYEQAANNASAGCRKIEGQLGVGKSFVDAACMYLQDNEESEDSELAELVSRWTLYCYQDALINDSGNDAAYWNEKFNDIVDGNSAVLTSALVNNNKLMEYMNECFEVIDIFRFRAAEELLIGDKVARLVTDDALPKDPGPKHYL